MMLSGGEVAVKLAGSVAKNTCVVRDELAERMGSLFCGKATAVVACHRHAAKSRLSNPTRARVIMPEKSPSGWMGFFLASYYGNDRIALGGSNHSRRGVHFNDSIM